MGGVGYGGRGSGREGKTWWEDGESRAAAREVEKVARGHGVYD